MENEEVSEAPVETNENTQVVESNDKPAGYNPVDPKTASPDEIQERLDYLYRQVKTNSREQNEWKSLAKEQSKLIADLQSGVGMVVNHLKTEKFAETEANLTRQIKDAFEGGDVAAMMEAQSKLTDLKVKQAVAQTPKQEVRQNLGVPAQNAQQLAREAQEAGEMSPQDAQYMTAWAAETDERGNPLRPWSNNPDPENPDPDFIKAAIVADQILKKNPNMPINQVLAEVDKKMGVSKSSGQTVMGGNLTRPQKSSKVSLTPQQERIAVKTKFGGPKAKSEADHIEAYRKQIETVRSAKGAK